MDLNNSTKFILDSGNISEYEKIKLVAEQNNSLLWGGTTNPSLIAKSADGVTKGKKFTQKEAFDFQKEIILKIVDLVPGAVSAEVYADLTTSPDHMIEQGREIATWHERVVVKLPTTLSGLKARSALRKEKINTNNTLVFSQEQIFAISLHEKIIQENFGPTTDLYPPFISPFVGRLDDVGDDGMELVENGIKIKNQITSTPQIWMLEASVRSLEHIKRGINAHTELITAPANLYEQWFTLSDEEKNNLDVSHKSNLKSIPLWVIPNELMSIKTENDFFEAISANKLNITHPLTDKGIVKFIDDWKSILIS